MERKAGILLPVSSLPSEYGIGCFSAEAYEFAERLCQSGQSYWQILPLGPTGFGDSPYQSFSTFAGNPYFISLEELIGEGVLSKKECDAADFGSCERYVDYEKLYKSRFKLLKKAFERTDLSAEKDYGQFEEENAFWLEDYSLFMAVKSHFGGAELGKWEKDIRDKKSFAEESYRYVLKKDIDFQKYMQYKFYSQWKNLKAYANKNGIKIIGDLPIYVSADSADFWNEPKLFQVDENNALKAVAGCPPDGFSPKGQLWGNPLYDWEYHKKTEFKWWIKRFEHYFKLYDAVRIDHFRGFDEYYAVPYGVEDASRGEWKKGPGAELFAETEKQTGKKEFIAEDLGFVTESVKKLLAVCGFPGMKVLEFAFDPRDTGNLSDYLPHNYEENCIAYTGTHDNQTLCGWFSQLSAKEKERVRDYLCDEQTPPQRINMPLIGLIMRSAARLCIVPLQDYMGLDDRARINIPSTLGINWKWRLKKGEPGRELWKKIYKVTAASSRI